MKDEEDAMSSQSPPPPAMSPPGHSSEAEKGTASATAATLVPRQHEVTLVLPIRKPRTPASASGGSSDFWSEAATLALIDAWGERFLELTRGNLKQKHWQEVADAVNSRDDEHVKPPKTDAQCKNRIDTLKKKYKLEKARMAGGEGGSVVPSISPWPFFQKLDGLVTHNPCTQVQQLQPGTTKKKRSKKKKKTTQKQLLQRPPPTSLPISPPKTTMPAVNWKRRKSDGGGGRGLSEVMRAVVKLGEVYERVERLKLQQAAEMQKQRMVFCREVELQRTQFFLKTQLELTQLKRHGRTKDSNPNSSNSNGNRNGNCSR